jgi:hypothetical protein
MKLKDKIITLAVAVTISAGAIMCIWAMAWIAYIIFHS